MRILVFSYEFLPSDSPQALRVARLMRELVTYGHEVNVIAAAGLVSPMAYEVIDGVVVHRINPGGVDGLVAWVKRLRLTKTVKQKSVARGPESLRNGLNWKGKCVLGLRRVMDFFLFPDARVLWVKVALRYAHARAADVGMPDLVIGSHEPAVGVMAAMRFSKETGVALVAELGDPILATYTAPRWHRRARHLERDVCEQSGAVVLTSEATAKLFESRHGGASKLHVIPQGFDPRPSIGVCANNDDGMLRLVYTGRFYPFRDPMPLLKAVAATERCECILASPELPADVEKLLRSGTSHCTWLGPVPHAEALRLQEGADLLVSIGNEGMTQVPGKVLEYMGSGRPILHVRPDEGDAAAALIEAERSGYVVSACVSDISDLLVDLAVKKKDGTLGKDLVLGASAFDKFSWRSLGQQLNSICTSTYEARS